MTNTILPKVYKVEEFKSLTGGSGMASFSGLRNAIKESTSLVKEVKSLINDWNTINIKAADTKKDVNISSKIEKGINAKESKVRIAYQDEAATQELKIFLNMIFEGIDESKTIKEARKEITSNLNKDFKPHVADFLRKHTEIYKG